MPRVICDLPNASDEISGVKFHPLDDGGRISDEISLEQAERFARIPGYEIDEEERDEKVIVPPPPPAAPVTRKSGGKKAAAPVVETPPPADPVSGDNEPTGAAGEPETVF